jgi:hypothetical protein
MINKRTVCLIGAFFDTKLTNALQIRMIYAKDRMRSLTSKDSKLYGMEPTTRTIFSSECLPRNSNMSYQQKLQGTFACFGVQANS